MKINFTDKVKRNLKKRNLGFLSSFLLMATIIVFISILIIAYNVNKNFKAVRISLNKFIICQQCTEKIKTNSNDLTELARMFIINKDERFAYAYLEEIENTQSQKKAFEELENVCSDKDVALQRLKITMTQAESIIAMELYDMKLCYEILEKEEFEVPERIRNIELSPSDKKLSKKELHELAVKNIFGNGFSIYKMRINENCLITVKTISDEIKREVDENAETLGRNLDRLRILIVVLLLINTLSTIGLKEFREITKSYNKIYEIKEKRTKKLLKDAEYDALTGLLNRHAYEQICKSTTEEKMSIALLIIDMDNFKHINDTYGHAGGDTALKALASILLDTFRNGDYVARIGGDEFAVILADFKPEGFKIISEKIDYINGRLSQIKGIQNISISVGMAHSPIGYNEMLYKQADKALYAVKEAGRKGSRVYDKSLQ